MEIWNSLETRDSVEVPHVSFCGAFSFLQLLTCSTVVNFFLLIDIPHIQLHLYIYRYAFLEIVTALLHEKRQKRHRQVTGGDGPPAVGIQHPCPDLKSFLN